MLSLEGKQLGNYDVIRRIRVGGMGAVYEGRQRTAFDRRVAIKVILGDYAADRDMRRRFAREARTVARLHHPHILPLIEFGDEQGILYLVMPFIDGGTLTSYLRRSLPGLNEISVIYQQLLDAVEYAHEEGLIHRDIKSSNVLLEQKRNGSPHAYLADFGLVRTSRQARMEVVGKPIPLDQVPGTPHYMAPEQTRGIVTTLTDIYALGVLLYQMLTGKLPYNDPDDVRVIQMHLQAPIPSPRDHDSTIPAGLATVVRIAMAKRPEGRYQNVAELRAAFLAALKEPSVAIQEEDVPIEPLPPPPRRFHSVSLAQEDAPVPIVIPQRATRNEVPVVVRERQRITEDIKQKPRTVRITEEQVIRKRKHLTGPMVTSILVPMFLLILLLMPRLLGISIFPVGFPVLGTPPIATIFITAQSKLLHNSYVLTSTSQINTPDLTTHTIPDRILQASATDSKTVQTTGSRTIAGVASQGTVIFTNAGNTVVTVQPQILSTPAGVQVQIKQAVQVPAHSGVQDGQAMASAVAVQAGVAGNIAAHTLDGPCCNGLMVKNLQAFSGGVDPHMIHIVKQSDLDGVQNALAPKIQQQVAQQLQKQMSSDEVMVGQPAYQIAVTSNNPVGAQADQAQVLVRVSGSVTVYNRNVADHTATQLLSKQAAQTLGSNYQLQETPTITAPPKAQLGQNGIVYLSVSVSGLWVYTLSSQEVSQWRQSIKGATSTAALAYLNEQPGIATAEIHLPFGTDHLPLSTDDIRIIQVGNGAS